MNVMKNKSVLITGANGGLGFETAKLLLKKNISHLVLTARTSKKADETLQLLNREKASGALVEAVGGFDMNSPDSIEQAVKNLAGKRRFDIVFFTSGRSRL